MSPFFKNNFSTALSYFPWWVHVQVHLVRSVPRQCMGAHRRHAPQVANTPVSHRSGEPPPFSHLWYVYIYIMNILILITHQSLAVVAHPCTLNAHAVGRAHTPIDAQHHQGTVLPRELGFRVQLVCCACCGCPHLYPGMVDGHNIDSAVVHDDSAARSARAVPRRF